MKTKDELKQDVLVWAKANLQRDKGIIVDISSVQDADQEMIFFPGTIEELFKESILKEDYSYSTNGDFERCYNDFDELIESCSDNFFDKIYNENYVELSDEEIKLVEQIFLDLKESEVFGNK